MFCFHRLSSDVLPWPVCWLADVHAPLHCQCFCHVTAIKFRRLIILASASNVLAANIVRGNCQKGQQQLGESHALADVGAGQLHTFCVEFDRSVVLRRQPMRADRSGLPHQLNCLISSTYDSLLQQTESNTS